MALIIRKTILVLFIIWATNTSFSQEGINVLISNNLEFDCPTHFKETEMQLGGTPEELPELIGGRDTLLQLLKYPEGLKAYQISGKVYAQIRISEMGSVQCYKIFSGLGDPFLLEVEKVIKQIKFLPAKNRGKPISYDITYSFTFDWESSYLHQKESQKKKRKRSK